MATEQQKARRRAQQRLARELREGTYRPGPAGRAYRAAVARRAGEPAGGNMGSAGWKKALHTTLNAAIFHARNLPQEAHVVIMGRGRSSGTSADPGQMAWLALHPAARPEWYGRSDSRDRLVAAVAILFGTPPRRYAVLWQLR